MMSKHENKPQKENHAKTNQSCELACNVGDNIRHIQIEWALMNKSIIDMLRTHGQRGFKKTSDLYAGAKPPALDVQDEVQVANQLWMTYWKQKQNIWCTYIYSIYQQTDQCTPPRKNKNRGSRMMNDTTHTPPHTYDSKPVCQSSIAKKACTVRRS